MLDLGLYIFYALLGVATIAAVLFPIVNALKTPGTLGKSAIGLGSLVVLFVISYVLADDSVSVKNAASFGITSGTSKLIGAGLIMFYITLVLSFIALVYSEISKALK